MYLPPDKLKFKLKCRQGQEGETMTGEKGKGTFVVKVLNTQDATWQGTISWLEGEKTQAFRSALELIKLVDSALTPKKGKEGQ